LKIVDNILYGQVFDFKELFSGYVMHRRAAVSHMLPSQQNLSLVFSASRFSIDDLTSLFLLFGKEKLIPLSLLRLLLELLLGSVCLINISRCCSSDSCFSLSLALSLSLSALISR
jgi:hypothetical protein